MTAGDVEVYGPFRADRPTEIDTGLTGNGIVVADNITAHVSRNMVSFTVIKAA